MSGQGQVKDHSETFSSFGLADRLDGLERGQTRPKCWIDIQKGHCISTQGIFSKGQGRGQVTKCHYKIEVTNLPCDTSSLGHFACRYRWWQSFTLWRHRTWLLTEVRWRSGQMRSNFQINICLHKEHMFLAQTFLRIPNMPLILFYQK